MAPGLIEVLRAIQAASDVSPRDVPLILSELERVRALLWARMLVPGGSPERGAAEIVPALLTVGEVAAALRFSRGHVYELVRSGNLRAVRNGRAVRIPAGALAEWQTRHRTGPVDLGDSVSLLSSYDRPRCEAHPAHPRAEPAGIRRSARRPQGHPGQVGDGRAGDAGARGKAHPASRRGRKGQSETRELEGRPQSAQAQSET